MDDAETELLTAQPAGARRAVVLQQAVERDMRTIERGVHMRTLYQHTARRSKATRDHVNLMIAHGAQVRTLDEFFHRLIVIDRRLAIVPGEASDVAVAVHDKNLVSYLADIFDRSWERAREYNERGTASDSDIAAEVRQLTVRMLTEGHSDPASAKRVGVSTRTYASYVAALKEEYGVETQVPARIRDGDQWDGVSPRQLTDSAAAPRSSAYLKPHPVSLVGGGGSLLEDGCVSRGRHARRGQANGEQDSGCGLENS